MTHKSHLLRTLVERGHVHQCSDLEGLDAAAASGVLSGYVGFDMTAPSLHVGNLASIMLLRRLQAAGGRPVVVLGGATTKVGDPSGKDESRRMLTPETIAAHMASIRGAFEKLLRFDASATGALLVDNDAWLSTYGYIDFLRTFGTHFTINRMLTFDSVRLRLDREQPLSFLEFNYMLMQAVDFLELNRRHGVRLQMGGADQWGNIINGVELCRRADGAEVFALTTPLITTASGTKMGKTAAGAVWLNPDMLSPYAYWQFWRNVEDADVGRFLRLFTDLPMDEIARLEALAGAEINEAKKVLATEATAMLHGRAEAERAAGAALETFEGAGRSADLPSVEIARADLEAGVRAAAAFELAGLVESRGEAKRHIKAGALRVNDVPVTDETAMLTPTDLDPDGAIKLSLGKKRHVLLRIRET